VRCNEINFLYSTVWVGLLNIARNTGRVQLAWRRAGSDDQE
jgi:hypothetical protein